MPLINFSGLASGIDSEALIKATSDATRSYRVTPHKRRITELEDTNDALSDLKKKLNELKTLLQGFSTASGGALTKSASSTDETKLTATASTSALNGSYRVTVNSLAKNATLSIRNSDTPYASSSAVLAPDIIEDTPEPDRTVSYTIGQGAGAETIDIALTSTMTLEEFATAFNSATTKAIATIVNVGTSADPDYRIVITTNSEGMASGSLIEASRGAAVPPELANELSQATDAQIAIEGITPAATYITRSSNTITDILPGITLSLVDTSASPITINVRDDTAATTSSVQKFIEKYNEIVALINENNQIKREEEGSEVSNIFSPLAQTRLDDNALTSLRNAISGSTYKEGEEIRIFADLGITTERDGTLKFNSTVFNQALSSDPNAVNTILKKFADTTALTNGTIDQYTRFNGLIDSARNSNTESIKTLNERIAQAEAAILRQESIMRQRFARLEQTIGAMQSQQQALSSALVGLMGNK